MTAREILINLIYTTPIGEEYDNKNADQALASLRSLVEGEKKDNDLWLILRAIFHWDMRYSWKRGYNQAISDVCKLFK